MATRTRTAGMVMFKTCPPFLLSSLSFFLSLKQDVHELPRMNDCFVNGDGAKMIDVCIFKAMGMKLCTPDTDTKAFSVGFLS